MKISVLLSTYNAEKYIYDAIKSVLNQSFQDFELIIIDDASTDRTVSIIERFNDKRIKLIKNTENRGLTVNLFNALYIAKGELIARMDADDVCFIDRFKEQVDFLDSNKKIDIVGSNVIIIDENNNIIGASNVFLKNRQIKSELLLINTLFHSSVMFRKSSLIDNNINYDISYKTCQDFKLWSDCVGKLKFANIKKPLLKYRVLSTGISRKEKKNKTIRINSVLPIYKELYEKYNIKIEDKYFDVILNLFHDVAKKQDVTILIKSLNIFLKYISKKNRTRSHVVL